MPEKLYSLLLKLYPDQFRREYGDEALRLIRDRARDEKGFLSGLRLWLDLLADLAISLPREHRRAPTKRIVAAQPVNGHAPFQLPAEPSLNPALLFLGATLSAALFWACVTFVAHNREFPARFQDSHSMQSLVQSDLALALARSSSEDEPDTGAYSFCMTASHDIPNNSAQPLLTVNFPPPGASGAALIDGKLTEQFRNEPSLSIRAAVPAGIHQVAINLDKPVGDISISGNGDFARCTPK